MIYIKTFKNYEEFKQIFAVRECGNGEKARQNKILLSCLKDRKFIHNLNNHVYLDSHAKAFWRINHMPLLLGWAKWALNSRSMYADTTRLHGSRIALQEWDFISEEFHFDERKGLCEDGSISHVRYVRNSDDRVFKMKAGKMINKVFETMLYLPLPMRRFVEETFTAEWKAYCQKEFEDYTLVVDEDFESIYDSYKCPGDFGSCMVDDKQHTFYNDAVCAKAASIRKGDKIYARCVIFTHVYDASGNKYRLAERQYSKDGDESLKRILVDKLIEAGEIDGYKIVGVDCHAADAFVSNDGESWSDKNFRIKCYLDDGDTLSYQDSFKWYDPDREIAYNYEDDDCCDLATTESEFKRPLDTVWSEIHDEYISEDEAVWVDSRNTYAYRSECTYLNDGWYLDTDIRTCAECGEEFYCDDSYYSDVTGQDYCCEYCLNEAEKDYKEQHWHYAKYDEEYYEYSSDVTTYMHHITGSDYEKTTISVEALDALASCGEFLEYDGEYYDEWDAETGLPYGVPQEELAEAV